MKRKLALFLITTLISICAFGSTSMLRSDRISLHYPATMSEEAAERLLADREAALAYAEDMLGCEVGHRITFIVVASMFGSSGGSRGSSTHVEYGLSLRSLQEFESDPAISPRNLGCHEEVHAVVDACWGRKSFALNEGLAVYIDASYRSDSDNGLIARGLLERNLLPSVASLPRLYLTFNRFNMGNYLTIYKGSASLVEYLISTYGMAAFLEFYLASGSELDLAEASVNLYGRSLSQLESDWHAHIRTETDGRELAAKLCVETFTPASELWEISAALRTMAQKNPRVFGRSDVYEKALDTRNASIDALQAATTDLEAKSAYQSYLCVEKQVVYACETWLKAATTYHSFLESRSALSIPEQSQLLRQAHDEYCIVGDELMVERVKERLDALLNQ